MGSKLAYRTERNINEKKTKNKYTTTALTKIDENNHFIRSF